MRLSASVNEDGSAQINGKRIALPNYIFQEVIGNGVNGVVFKARHGYLELDRAIKFWLRLKARDARDKFAQGIAETRKAVALASSYAVQVHEAGEIDGLFFCVMEFISGRPLQAVLQDPKLTFDKNFTIAREFLYAVSASTKEDTFHGDMHGGNVLVTPSSVRIVDFGTSIFTSNAYSRSRHWSVVHETFNKILQPLNIDYLYQGDLNRLRKVEWVADWNKWRDPLPDYSAFRLSLLRLVRHCWADEIEKAGMDFEDSATVKPEISRKLMAIKPRVPLESIMPFIYRIQVETEWENELTGPAFRFDYHGINLLED